MANNQYVNKVVNGESGVTLIDLTSDTAVASDVALGKYFHLASGERVQGTASGGGGGGGAVIQDQDGYLVLSDQGGGSSVQVDPLSVTQNGTYTAQSGHAYSPVTVNVSSGGGGGDIPNPIRFFDYDGTLVASYTSVPESLPNVPTHTGLTNGTWNYTLAQITTQFNTIGMCDVGANYDTVSGATEIDIILQPERLRPYLSLAVNGVVAIDWGDGSTTTSVGTSLTSRKDDIYHEYAAAGSYTIKISMTSGTGYSLLCTSTYSLLNKGVSVQLANRVYSNCVQNVRVGSDCTIGNYAFYNCYSLASVTIPSGVTSIGNSAFYNCYSLESVTIPFGVTSTGTSVFYNCYSLESVTIPSSVTSIGNGAFSYCASLTSVAIPSGVTSIGTTAFYCCYSLVSVVIPSGVTSIAGQTFASCYSLTPITIPSGVTSIGASAFSSCFSLTSITIPYGVTTIDSTAFYCCYSLKSITIPSSVTTIGAQAFYFCYSLESATIPSGVTTLDTVFDACYSLTSVTIPSSVTTIGNTTFASCYSLASITIPSSVTSIGTSAFNNCYSLTSLTIPSGVTSISSSAFSSCYGMAEYHIKPTTPPTLANANAFTNIQTDCKIYVPSASLTDYQTATNWSTYSSYMVGE